MSIISTLFKWLFYLILGCFGIYLIGMGLYNPKLIGLNFYFLATLFITPLFVLGFKRFVEKHKVRMYRVVDAVEYVQEHNRLLSQEEILKVLFLSDLEYVKKTGKTFFLIFWFLAGDRIISQVVNSNFDTEKIKKFKDKSEDKYKGYAQELYSTMDQFIYLTAPKINDNIFKDNEYLQNLRASETEVLIIPKFAVAALNAKKKQEEDEKLQN